MKTSLDPRHIARQKIIQEIFALSFYHYETKNRIAIKILENREKIDRIIAAAAPQWPLEQIAKVDIAILRLAIYELMISKENPPKVIIDEAVELSKEFGGEASSRFINGVLGTVVKSFKI